MQRTYLKLILIFAARTYIVLLIGRKYTFDYAPGTSPVVPDPSIGLYFPQLTETRSVSLANLMYPLGVARE